MNQGEFYGSNEYNSISEYKHFPAETYRKPREENQCGKEDADLGKESTSLQPKPRHPKKSGDTGTLIDKIFSTIRGATAVATVAASVVVTSSLAAGTPEAELLSYACSDTYIEYEMEISGLDEDGEYAIVLSTTDEEDVETEVNGDGTYSNRIDGLKPEWEYTLALIEYDSVLGEIRHFEIKLQTLKYSDQDPIPPPITEPEPNPEPEPEPKPIPSVSVKGAEIVRLNEVNIYFESADIPSGGVVELDILFGDLNTSKISLTDADIAKGYLTIEAEASATLTVTPTVIAINNGEEEKTVCESFTYTFEENLTVDTMVGLSAYDPNITFYLSGITCGADRLTVISSLDPENPQTLDISEAVKMEYTPQDEVTYTMYLSNETNDILSNEVSVTLNTAREIPELNYNMQYPFPSELSITYNDDGTINIYVPTGFESDDDGVYYQVSLNGMRYTSREPLLRAENIPDISYEIRYDVCIDIDGQQYSVFHMYHSGMANEAYFYFESDFMDNVLSMKLDKEYMHLDLSTVRLVSSAGEEIILTESDFTYNEVYSTYDAVVEFTEYADEVVIYLMANPYYNGLEEIDGYIGNTRKIFEVTVYQP